ncbi:hypothetical protein PAPYR_11182 [Paratrimastix pyriformis]|uniref:Uncharacterized protein n=1 Tax=Paratrimastix pyriformis TaxID=342808 RepID=A0ABQ8U4A7_9EUKA|nr:hypothetical protein PAPYR_11182 [Paratrimastix pyriformis]
MKILERADSTPVCFRGSKSFTPLSPLLQRCCSIFVSSRFYGITSSASGPVGLFLGKTSDRSRFHLIICQFALRDYALASIFGKPSL